MWRFYVLSFLSLTLLVSYFIVPRLFPTVPLKSLWGGIHSVWLQWVYTVSMLLCALSFLVVMAYFYGHASSSLFAAVVCFLVFSLLWMPFMFVSLRGTASFTVLMVMTLAAIAACALWVVMALVAADHNARTAWHATALAAAIYLFLHTFLLDFIVFSTAYLMD